MSKKNVLSVQEGGDHYKMMGKYQPVEVLNIWLTPEENRGYHKGVAIGYLAREKQKGGDLDIKKAIHHLQMYLKLSEKDVKVSTE